RAAIGGAIAAAAVIVVGLWQLTRPSTNAADPAPGQGSATVVSSAAPTMVTIKLAASPKEARLFLDDKPLDGNPWKGSLPSDTLVHKLRIEAPGFTTRN